MFKSRPFSLLVCVSLVTLFAAPAWAADKAKPLVDDWYTYTGRRGMTGYLHVTKRATGRKLAPIEFVHDLVVTVKNERLSLHQETLCKDDAFYTPLKITSKGEGDDEILSYTANIDWRKTDAGTVGTLTTTIRGRERTLKLPEHTITFFGLFEVVKQRPFKKDDVLTFHSLEASELNLKKDNTLTCVGEEKLAIRGHALKAHKFEHRHGERLVTEFWLNEKRQLVRARIDGSKTMILATKKDATATLEALKPADAPKPEGMTVKLPRAIGCCGRYVECGGMTPL